MFKRDMLRLAWRQSFMNGRNGTPGPLKISGEVRPCQDAAGMAAHRNAPKEVMVSRSAEARWSSSLSVPLI